MSTFTVKTDISTRTYPTEDEADEEARTWASLGMVAVVTENQDE